MTAFYHQLLRIKFSFYVTTFALVALSLGSCHSEGSKDAAVDNEPDPPVWTFNPEDTEPGTPDFETFDIDFDYSELKEKVYTDPSNILYVENANIKEEISINYQGDKATVKCDNPSAFSVQTNGAHVTINTTKDVACTLTGKSDNGSLRIMGNNTVRINLKGVNLKNANGPSINNRSKALCYLVTDSASVLSDDRLYVKVDEEDKQTGCLCSKGEMAISGRAPLKIIAKGADAIHSGKNIFVRRGTNIDIESRGGSAIKAKRQVKVEGGVLNINSLGRGGHGIAAKDIVEIAGGRTTIISNTGAGIDGKNSRGIKSDSIVAITGGIVRVKESSVGGKGIRAGHRFLAKNCMIDVLTFSEDDKVTGSKNRGIKGVDEIRIDSSRVRVRTENGWNEGLSSRSKISISNSLVELMTRDDAISAGDPETADIEINNSMIFADAGMDCIDSNGTMHVNSGVIFSIARSHLCRGFDCDVKEFKIGPEAIIVSLGEITSPPTAKLLEHPVCLVMGPAKGSEFCVTPAGKNENLISFPAPKHRFSDSAFRVLLSLPEFKTDESYEFCRQATVNPKRTFHGLKIGGTAENKSVVEKHTLGKGYCVFSPPVPTPPRTTAPQAKPRATGNTPVKPQANPQAKPQAKPQPKTPEKPHVDEQSV